MQTNKFTLQQYSSIAGVLLLLNKNADAGAVYTNLEPDIELQFEDETVNIDIDNNGVFDFLFLKTAIESYYFSSVSTPVQYRSRRGFWAGPVGTSNNKIAGAYATDDGDPTTYFVDKFNYGDLINNALDFQSADFQIMEIVDIRIGIDDEWRFAAGQWAHDPQNKYVGVRFMGDDACLHYGWIRCSIQDTANILIIHDYAYESKCSTGIFAGDTIGDTTVGLADINNLDAVVYSFGTEVYVTLNAKIPHAQMRVYNLEGKVIYAAQLQNQFTQIMLDASKGIYLVEIIAGEGRYTKKVYLD